MKQNILLFLSILALCLCCKPENKPETYYNALEELQPGTKPYRDYVLQFIAAFPGEFSYTITGYENKSGEYLILTIQNKKVNITEKVLVTGLAKLAEIRKTKAEGWHGAKLEGPQFEVYNNGNQVLVLLDLKRIMD
ncbi:hypothetical protein [Flavobacterium cyanobacteriorum]|nr:hypothetical protein [Flavobacterium cyanobacteriorum]